MTRGLQTFSGQRFLSWTVWQGFYKYFVSVWPLPCECVWQWNHEHYEET
jgi:hypothetical protein